MEKLICLLSISAIILISFPLQAQENAEWLVEVNSSSGSFQTIDTSIEGIGLIFGGLYCEDEVNEQYIFVNADLNVAFNSIDINTGEIVDQTPFPGLYPQAMRGFHCFNNCDSLVIVTADVENQRNYIALFDKYNGTAFIQIGDSLVGDDFIAGIVHTTFDGVNNLLYAYSIAHSLLEVFQIPSGTLISSFQINQNLLSIEYDVENDKVYGLKQWGLDGLQLLDFDPILGQFTPVGLAFETSSTGYVTSTIDAVNSRLCVFRHSNEFGSYLTTIDLNTGEMLAEFQLMPGDPSGGFFGGPNVINGAYFNSSERLIALHWGSGSHTVSNQDKLINTSKVSVYPNPNNGEFRLDCDALGAQQARISIADASGKIIYQGLVEQDNQLFNLQLSPGYYVAEIEAPRNLQVERTSFIVVGQ